MGKQESASLKSHEGKRWISHTSLKNTQNPTNTVMLLSPLVLLLFNSRMQLRIHRWEMQPSQGELADTAHCCMGVDALHEVRCCSVWERGEKTECPLLPSRFQAAPNSPTSIKSRLTSGQVTDKIGLPARVR
uniref:Uncharacterized protein n=1 Tax=Peromyscus maniculatus bairdii TaxID=230844 RepID=A0A8C8ULZ6_PERMB